MVKTGIIILVAFLLGCSSLILDPSIPALEAKDYTLVLSACENTPGIGMDICRVTEGDTIASSWKLIVPQGTPIEGGEVNVYYRDIHKQYSIGGSVVEIPWREFFGADKWSDDMDGEALALVLIRWKDDRGIIQVTKFRGIAKIVVTKQGYDKLPIDSGLNQWGTKCKVQYSTAGRSALKCE